MKWSGLISGSQPRGSLSDGREGRQRPYVLKSGVRVTGVKEGIKAALKRRATNEAKNIVVEVNVSDVILSGTTDTLSERTLVSDSAWVTTGVHNLFNNILAV